MPNSRVSNSRVSNSRSRPLRIVSYNIHRAIGLDRKFRLDRIVSILEHHSPDIALLQEVDDGAPRSQGLDLAKQLAEALDYPHYAVGHNVTLRKGRYGNATLSRFPIVEERNIDLTIGWRKKRGCQYARVALPVSGQPEAHLDVFNVHLGLSATERNKQVRRLVQADEFQRLDEETACVIGGDFNDWRSLMRPFFTQQFNFRAATDRPHPTGRPDAIRTFPSFSPAGALDRVYFRGETLELNDAQRCDLKVSKHASDHLPVIVDFEVK